MFLRILILTSAALVACQGLPTGDDNSAGEKALRAEDPDPVLVLALIMKKILHAAQGHNNDDCKCLEAIKRIDGLINFGEYCMPGQYIRVGGLVTTTLITKKITWQQMWSQWSSCNLDLC